MSDEELAERDFWMAEWIRAAFGRRTGGERPFERRMRIKIKRLCEAELSRFDSYYQRDRRSLKRAP